MRTLIVVALCFLTVWCQEQTLYGETGEPEPEEGPDADEVQRAASVLAGSLGFQCGKGHQCVPALVPVPCDYGTFKDREGIWNCVPCEPGCTTLRKGAESMYECVPFCPHGYERSHGTCTPCRPGYYKSSWLDEDCSSCPEDSNPDPDTIGMSSETECYGDGSDPEPEEPQCPEAACGAEEEMERRPLVGSQCTKYCECSKFEAFFGQYDYIWQPRTCPHGMLFGGFTRTCLDSVAFWCNETDGSVFPTTESSSQSPMSSSSRTTPSSPSSEWSSSGTMPPSPSSEWSSSGTMPSSSGSEWSSSGTMPSWSSSGTMPPSPSSEWSSSGTMPPSTSSEWSSSGNMPSSPSSGWSSTTVAPDVPDLECPTVNFELVIVNGSGCRKYYECANSQWVKMDCPAGTRFFSDVGSCIWEDSFTCQEDNGTDGEENSTTDGEVLTGCPETSCSYYTLELLLSIGSQCTQYCQCTAKDNSLQYHWVEKPCASETLFSKDLGICDHAGNVACDELTP